MPEINQNLGEAAVINFAAAWLNAQVSLMNAENMQRQHEGQSMAYGLDAYVTVIEEAEKMLAEAQATERKKSAHA